jgi:hypothetical protein|tara:strand:- start:6062 stop:6787 length:726 start_codon:yes stop_codon:yes gene_type:complete
MKYFFILLFLSIITITSLVFINLPFRTIEPFLAEYFPEIKYEEIEGTIWSGKISDIYFADEYLGDLNTEFDLRKFKFYLSDKNFYLNGEGNLFNYLLDEEIYIKNVNFDLNSRKFLKRIPSISNVSGKDISMTFDASGCYEISGNILADLDRKGLLNNKYTTKIEGSLGCKNKKLIGNFYSTPNQDIIKGNFSVDKELNYELEGSSAILISKISKILKNPLNARIPDIKVKGNLYNFFYGE